MAVLSILRRTLPVTKCFYNHGLANGLKIRNSSTLDVLPSKWTFQKFWDLIHFYLLLGIFPLCGIVTYVNIFIGPAQLAEIPEGYIPEFHEYHPHPISRFFQKYINKTHQQEYEQFLGHIYEEKEKQEMRRYKKLAYVLMRTKGDSTAIWYRAPPIKYLMSVREEFDNRKEFTGEN